MWKKLQLHALPTDKATDFGQCIEDMSDVKIGEWKKIVPMMMSLEYWEPHHLYLTSDEDIKEGDWFFNPATNEVLFASKDMLSWNSDTTQQHKGWRKIIATTNPDLQIIPKFYRSPENKNNNVPKIPQSLIEYFVQQQGNVKEVLVEYETHNSDVELATNLSLTPSGKIIWKPVEEEVYTWNDIEKAYLIGYLQQIPSVLNFPEEVEVHKKKLIQLKEWFDNLS